MPVTGFALASGVPNVILGAVQAYQGFKGLKKLQKQAMPQFSVSPELQGAYSRAQGMSNQGFTGAEMGAAQQGIAQQGNVAFQRARNLAGGTLAGAINAGIKSNQIGGVNQLAANDAQLRRQNIRYADTLAQDIQQQNNMETQRAFQYRMAQEQALGGAAQSGLKNIASGLSSGLGMAAKVKLYQSMNNPDPALIDQEGWDNNIGSKVDYNTIMNNQYSTTG